MNGPAAANQMDPQLASSLLQVPLGILLRITYHIPTPDLTNVRLTCKALESRLFNFFAHEFFRKKQFMVSTSSLQALIDISKHATLAPFLKHVIIATDRPGTAYVSAFANSADMAAKMRNLQIAQGDAKMLMSGALCRDMLAEAFANLPNLQVVDLRDFNSPTRNRDGFGVPWRSFGSVELARFIGTPVTTHPIGIDDDYASALFTNIASALATANARPKNIEVVLRNRNWGLFDWAFSIPPHLESSFASVLSDLKTLHLSLSMKQEPLMLRKFLSYATNVTWLRVNFNYVGPEESHRLFSWLALDEGVDDPQYTSPEMSRFQVKGVAFPQLECFDIGNADVWPDTLLSLFRKFAPTLKNASLRRVALSERNRDPDQKINPWVPFMDQLLRVPGIEQLKVLDFSQLGHITRYGWRGAVYFGGQDKGRQVREYKCSTAQATLQTEIKAVKSMCTADWPNPPPPVHASDSDGDEDDEDDTDMGDD